MELYPELTLLNKALLATSNTAIATIQLNDQLQIIDINSAAAALLQKDPASLLDLNLNLLLQQINCPLQLDSNTMPSHPDTTIATTRLLNKTQTWTISKIISESGQTFMNMLGVYSGEDNVANDLNTQYLLNVINNVPHFIFWKDTNSIFLGCNKQFADAIGFKSTDDIIGLSDFDMPWTDIQSHDYIQDDYLVMTSGIPKLGYEESQTQQDGTIRTHLVSKTPMKNNHGETIGVLGIYTDITARKTMEENLTAAKKQAEQSDQAKTQFLAAVSHELKTPLNCILGCAELLRQKLHDNNQSSLLDDIHEATTSLSLLVNDILDYSHLQSCSFTISTIAFSFKKMVTTIFEQVQHRPSTHPIEFTLYYDDTIPARLVGDPLRIQQLIGNLLSNAIKFTPQGTVSLNVQCCSIEHGHASINIEVIDTGVGIPEEQQEKIFNPFTQIHHEGHFYHDGVGLGLSIYKQLAETMHASYGVNSKPGHGSCFWCQLSLPLAQPPVESVIETKPLCELNATVLIIEDNPLNQKIIGRFMSELDCQYIIRETGKSGVAYLEENSVDLVLLDLGLPDIDGFQVADLIHNLNPIIPIVLLTAYNVDEQRVKQHHIRQLLLKPVTLNVLSKTLSTLLDI